MSKLSVRGLRAYYMTEAGPLRAVDGVSFELDQNEIIGIVGESGSGKSSLGAALMHSMQPPGKMLEGTIELDGHNISQLSEPIFNHKIRWKKVSMVFQGAMNVLDPVYTIESQLIEILREHGVDQRRWKEKISVSLQSVGLDPAIGRRYPHELSGGMKQRVVIAMAILLQPDLLIADEPTTALDVLMQKKIIDLLKKLRNERKMNVILVSHDLALMSSIADKLAIMYAGHIVEIGSTKEIYKNPRHPYTQALIKAIPRLPSEDKKIHFIPGSPQALVDPHKGCRFYERCPYAMEVCKNSVPEFSTESGYVRCWLYDPASCIENSN
ncbi:MAG TPA: ABC transporter ATP-binding protein [Nitrososphaera sp.]|nr:ABC transporter ATP-binding protein [Nitrososphaera sp.]